MKQTVIAIVGFVTMSLFIAWAQKRRGEEIPRPPESFPTREGQPPTDDEVRRLVAAGQKIEAIKLYRELHGGGLKDAKDAVEKMEERKG